MLPQIALVIDDLGLDPGRSKRAMDLPIPLTLAFLPFAAELKQQTEYGREQPQRHELLVHIPMEPVAKTTEPGPNALLTSSSRKEVLRNLDINLRQFCGYVGISNHMGSKFTADAKKMLWVMEELKSRGLFFLDSRTTAHSAAKMAAELATVPFIERDVFLDHRDEESAIREQLEKTLKMAQKKGLAVAVGHPREATLNALEEWLTAEKAVNCQFVTLSKIIKRLTKKP